MPSAALHLFYTICEQLGRPMTPDIREGRVEPKHLRHIWARDVTPGMYVAEIKRRAAADWPRVVESIEDLPGNNRRLHYVDGSVQMVSAYTLMNRELTEAEIARVQEFMSQYVGRGVVRAVTADTPPPPPYSVAS